MKQFIINALAAMTLSFAIETANVAAEDRFKEYEMADGFYIKFKMTPEEIKAEDAEKARRDALRKLNASNLPKWVNIYEMGESGRVIEFPMSVEEIQVAKRDAIKEADRKEASRLAKAKKAANTETTTIETADGNTITFTKKSR